ncbi:MAG TPA: carbonic anhydrase [Bryobacteraceae bacterium]|nr:carbonic anhydrase [Bryobacteraceae bacterium]
MKKLIQGILEFRRNVRPDYRETFARLALGQAPDALFIACSDSRVVPNLFASADPGDLFVIRNVGNLVAPAGEDGVARSDGSEAAAIEFALAQLPVTDIIVCGHSECGAMHAMLNGRRGVEPYHLRCWLRHADPALERLATQPDSDSPLAPHNRLSQLNVLAQIEHLKTYPLVRDRVAAAHLRLHGWWFELRSAEVYAYEDSLSRFVPIDDAQATRMLRRLS